MAVLIVDIGNTRTKIGVFEGGSLRDLINTDDAPESALEECFSQWKVEELFISTVRANEILKRYLNKKGVSFELLDHRTRLPLTMDYSTPETLGKDRIAAVTGAWHLSGGSNLLVIDAGTCITYDWVSERGKYLGGNIAPGLHMRLQAMHDLTHSLPLAKSTDLDGLQGKSTNEALYYGGAYGVLAEVDFYHRKTDWDHFELYLTGGAGEWISEQLQVPHHYEKDLVIKGLYEIYSFHH
ncbi:MAG TPA: type III pantothenate kinase [Saprospiraceae bacterium]|nr:type III pantothenate kinase [Saprospiraceae bacterium]